jgi:hypothetical protein
MLDAAHSECEEWEGAYNEAGASGECCGGHGLLANACERIIVEVQLMSEDAVCCVCELLKVSRIQFIVNGCSRSGQMFARSKGVMCVGSADVSRPASLISRATVLSMVVWHMANINSRASPGPLAVVYLLITG